MKVLFNPELKKEMGGEKQTKDYLENAFNKVNEILRKADFYKTNKIIIDLELVDIEGKFCLKLF